VLALPNLKNRLQKNKKAPRQKKLSASVVTHYLERMKTAAAKKKRRRTRNPFACKGWREFVMRSARADQAARAAAQARVTATGETLH
jgi:hypothetical protein